MTESPAALTIADMEEGERIAHAENRAKPVSVRP